MTTHGSTVELQFCVCNERIRGYYPLHTPVKSPQADLTWTKGAKRLMANLGRFAEMLSSFDEQEVLSSVLLDNLSLYLEDNAMDLNYHKSMGHPDAVLQICHWVNNVVRYVFMCTYIGIAECHWAGLEAEYRSLDFCCKTIA